MVGVIGLRASAAASAVKSADHVDRWTGAQGRLVVVVAAVLKTDLVHGFGSENVRVADLHGMFGGVRVVAGGGERESSDSGIVLGVPVELVAGGQRVVLADLVVEA